MGNDFAHDPERTRRPARSGRGSALREDLRSPDRPAQAAPQLRARVRAAHPRAGAPAAAPDPRRLPGGQPRRRRQPDLRGRRDRGRGRDARAGSRCRWRLRPARRARGRRAASARRSTRWSSITDFGEPVCRASVTSASVERGGDKPYHVVINGENHHALEALRFTHAGKVDCIYIDPPYNTGARDWKYNNDYVDDDDAYRHSKWLAFMERRLKLAKELLNPDDSVLIVTIDEKEYLRLGTAAGADLPRSATSRW